MVKHNAQKKKVSFIYFHLCCEIGNCSVYIYMYVLFHTLHFTATSWICLTALYAYFAPFLFNIMKRGEFLKLMHCLTNFISVLVDKCR